MKKVAIFGKPGSGKSYLTKALSKEKGLPSHSLDSIFYQPNGLPVERAIFDEAHSNILAQDEWIIDGLGPLAAFNQRLEAADTLVYIDLPYAICYWFVFKRLVKGLFVTPLGWPQGSSIIKGSLASIQFLRLSPHFWNDDFSSKLQSYASVKHVYVIKTLAELNGFINQLGSQDAN